MDLFVVYPLFPSRKFFLGVVLAYKRGTNKNTKTTTATTNTVDLISGGWEDDRVNDIAKQVKQVIR